MKTLANKITGANAGGSRQLPMRTRWAARVAQFCRSANSPFMKKSNVVFICVLVFVLGAALGYRVGLRRALHKIGDEMVGDQLRDAQHASEAEARGYLFSLQALDSGRAEDITHFRERALSHLRGYVHEVRDLQAEGYTWTPVNHQFYSNAVAYLTDHPKEK